MSWVSHRDLHGNAKVRLFCLPHAGSGAAGFYRWKRMLPAALAVCPVMLPGREARLGEKSLRSVDAIVSAMHAELKPYLAEPYAIFGHSMSALVAFEWARRIESEGLAPPLCLFASGRNAPQHTPGHRGLHRLGAEEMVHELGRLYGGDSDALLAEPELREVFLPILRADLEVVESYEFIPARPLSCAVVAYAGSLDTSVSIEGLHEWSATTAGSFSSRRFPGDHFYHLGSGQQDLLVDLRRELEI